MSGKLAKCLISVDLPQAILPSIETLKGLLSLFITSIGNTQAEILFGKFSYKCFTDPMCLDR